MDEENKIRLLDIETMPEWNDAEFDRQIKVRVELINKCLGSLYPSIYSAQIRDIRTAQRIRSEHE